MRALCVLACLAGCQTTGAVELTLDLPTSADLKPTGMTTVTVVATGSDGVPSSTTSVLGAGGAFTAGDLPVESGVQIDIELRDVSNRLVGLGQAPTLVDISGTATSTVEIPVRRPFVYATTPDALVSFDPTVDARDPKFQNQVAGVASPLFAISVGGDRLAVVSSTSVQAIDTSTNAVSGDPIALPGPANDATAVPGTHQVAVAYAHGIAIVDLDTGMVSDTSGKAAVDRITVGAAADGTMTAYGLVGRVVAPIGPVDDCTGTSQIVSVPVATPGAFASLDINAALSDIAADPSAGMLFATAPCAGKVELVNADGSLKDVTTLERAAVLTVLGGRIWAAGSHPSTPTCLDASGAMTQCLPTSDESCPATGQPDNYVDFVTEGANLIVESIPTQTRDAPIVFDVPSRRETIINTDDEAGEHAQVLKAINLQPIDLVALPGGQYVSLVTHSSYFVQELVNRDGVVLPCLQAETGDWLLMDMGSVSIASRVRTECLLSIGASNEGFEKWACDLPPDQETSTQGDYQPTSVGALFGAR